MTGSSLAALVVTYNRADQIARTVAALLASDIDHLLVSQMIESPVLGRGREPGAGLVGQAVERPAIQRGHHSRKANDLGAGTDDGGDFQLAGVHW